MHYKTPWMEMGIASGFTAVVIFFGYCTWKAVELSQRKYGDETIEKAVERIKPSPPRTQLVESAYVWVNRRGFITAGQLRNVPPECFHGWDTIKGWAHGLIKRPVVGDEW